MSWTYGRRLHRRATIEALAQRFLDELQQLIDHCRAPEAGGYTASDFPEADLSNDELASILAQLE